MYHRVVLAYKVEEVQRVEWHFIEKFALIPSICVWEQRFSGLPIKQIKIDTECSLITAINNIHPPKQETKWNILIQSITKKISDFFLFKIHSLFM